MSKATYLKNPSRCPFCDGGDIRASNNYYFGGADTNTLIYTESHCENCGKEWLEVYKLMDIEEIVEELPETELNPRKYWFQFWK